MQMSDIKLCEGTINLARGLSIIFNTPGHLKNKHFWGFKRSISCYVVVVVVRE